ncbi:MAG TPA: efflux RND transporter periplasmic adaptor subunit [Steroidobacteraceae bacterium]|jgi:cobalt-zinc-cadmium efflux system membrane fusion protein|nr:efflux RND transporter periplasmic adaptor subunit [Steroidobacteraceae bacterium]
MSDQSLFTRFGRRGTLLGLTLIVAVLLVWYLTEPARRTPAGALPSAAVTPAADIVTLSDSQLGSITVGTVAERDFRVEKEAVGNIDFNEDRSVQVFSPYQGRIIKAYVDLGDEVRAGQLLFTIESPDFVAAQSTLITAAATLDQAASALRRAESLYAGKAIDQNDYETALANDKSADGALHAARHAVAIFGKTEAEIDHIVASRQVETALLVKSPIIGRITARNAAPGMLEQPGVAPAPYSVADPSTMWMLADVPEADIGAYKLGDPLRVSVMAYPGRVFIGKVTAIGAAVDPNSRRVTLRSVIEDPKHELWSQMFATFVTRTAPPIRSPAIPLNGVVREGDGTMSVWVVDADPHRFTRRIVKVGLQQDGYDQILDGLKAGERVAVDGAIFLSNILFGGAS